MIRTEQRPRDTAFGAQVFTRSCDSWNPGFNPVSGAGPSAPGRCAGGSQGPSEDGWGGGVGPSFSLRSFLRFSIVAPWLLLSSGAPQETLHSDGCGDGVPGFPRGHHPASGAAWGRASGKEMPSPPKAAELGDLGRAGTEGRALWVPKVTGCLGRQRGLTPRTVGSRSVAVGAQE